MPTVIRFRERRLAFGPISRRIFAVDAVMAKKKSTPKPEQRVRTAVTNIRSMPEWKEWLGRFADAQRKDVSDLIDEALVRMARAEGFEMPPKR
jgi:hypothetical protein